MSRRRGYPFVLLGLPLGLIVLFMAAPLISLFVAGGIADLMDCNLPVSSSASPCSVLGADLSGTLTLMIFVGYLAFWTLPVGTTALAIWLLVAAIVTLVWWWRRHREA